MNTHLKLLTHYPTNSQARSINVQKSKIPLSIENPPKDGLALFQNRILKGDAQKGKLPSVHNTKESELNQVLNIGKIFQHKKESALRSPESQEQAFGSGKKKQRKIHLIKVSSKNESSRQSDDSQVHQQQLALGRKLNFNEPRAILSPDLQEGGPQGPVSRLVANWKQDNEIITKAQFGPIHQQNSLIRRLKSPTRTNLVQVRIPPPKLPLLPKEKEQQKREEENQNVITDLRCGQQVQFRKINFTCSPREYDNKAATQDLKLHNEDIGVENEVKPTFESKSAHRRIILNARTNKEDNGLVIKIEENAQIPEPVSIQTNPTPVPIQESETATSPKPFQTYRFRAGTPPQVDIKGSKTRPFVRRNILKSFESINLQRKNNKGKTSGSQNLVRENINQDSVSHPEHASENHSEHHLQSFCFEELSTVNSALITSDEGDSHGVILAEIPEDASETEEPAHLLQPTGLLQTSLSGSKSASSFLRESVEIEYTGELDRLCMLGNGSEAKVYLVRLIDYSEDLLALKEYEIMTSDKEGVKKYEKLKKEFYMLRQLDHPYIIQYYSMFRPNEKGKCINTLTFGVLMEYMPGGSLATYIEENHKNLSLEEKKQFIKQILLGLACLHENNVIHRDLKVIYW